MARNYSKYQPAPHGASTSRADHLKKYRWPKGTSGNPDGRPTGSISLVEQLKVYLRQHPEDVEAIVVALIKQGKLGNTVATKEMLDRIDGKVAETHKIEGELPITLLFVPAEQVLKKDE